MSNVTAIVELTEVIEYHCDPLRQQTPSDTTVPVHAADLACQKLGMGYGYELELAEASSLERIWEALKPRFPMARAFTEESFTKLFIHLAFEAEKLADHVFTPVMTIGCASAEPSSTKPEHAH